MRSNTLTPLLQFIDWWGLDPWYVAGIDLEGVTSPSAPSATRITNDDRCTCMVQHPWDSKDKWSRDDLIEMLAMAERFFVDESKIYPAPFFIEDEQYQYPIKNKSIGFSLVNSEGWYKSIRPEYPCYLSAFGGYSLVLNSTETLTRDILGAIQNEFTATFVVPAGTLASQIRVYFTPADGGYSGTPHFNDHTFEIRPLEISVSGVSATITGGAYLFKDPALDEETDCVQHELANYVEDVYVYITTQDVCGQGNFICPVDNCSTVPCSPTESSLCMTTKKVGFQTWGTPQPANCADDVFTKTCLTCVPMEVEYNYLTGKELEDGYIDSNYLSAIAKLAVGLADCIRAWCECSVCPDQKVKYYRTVPKALRGLDTDVSEFNRDWQVMVTKETLETLEGLPPYNGILQGLRFIRNEKCTSVEGAIL
jgi:hypothetical protein